MSSYDDWRQESDRDYEDRMHVHDRGPRVVYDQSGHCACGEETTRAVSDGTGYRWECRKCSAKAFDALFNRAVRQAS